jgi:hypothetical protein
MARERERAGRVDALERERRRARSDLRSLRLVRELPDEEAEQTGHRRQRDDLAAQLQRAHQDATI